MRTWVKLYTEINRDPKMLRLTWAQRGIWSALLALAGEIDDQDEDGITGYVGLVDDVALLLRCDDKDFRGAVSAFIERGMVDDRDGLLYVTRYADRQQRAPSTAREAVTQRVQRHRRRQLVTRNEHVTTLHADVTTTQRGVTPSDSESDTDTDAEAGACAPDDGDDGTAELFKLVESAGILVSQAMADQYIAVLDDDAGGDMVLLRAAFKEAADTGARPMPKWLRTVVWRCKREGCMPGQWRDNASAQPRASPEAADPWPEGGLGWSSDLTGEVGVIGGKDNGK